MQTLSFLNILSESPQYQDARHDLIKRSIARPLGFEAEGRRFESKVHVCCLYVASHAPWPSNRHSMLQSKTSLHSRGKVSLALSTGISLPTFWRLGFMLDVRSNGPDWSMLQEKLR